MRDLRRLAALALAALLLCGGALPCAAAASDATVAAESDLPPEAESFYQSILAAMDQQTLQAYLGCFSRERQLELWSMLDTTRQRRLTQAMALLGQSPPTAAPTPDARTPSWELTGETAWDAETGCYTLRLEAWATVAQPPAALKYCLDPAMDASLATVRVWAVDKTHGGWSQVKRELPDVRVSLEEGLLTVEDFDFSAGRMDGAPRLDAQGRTEYGCKLVVQMAGLRAAQSTFGGQGIPVGSGGVVGTADDTWYASFPEARVDLPLHCRYQPTDQQIAQGDPVNFGYMINPPRGGVGELPDGTNNAWCAVRYTVRDPDGQVMGIFSVPAGQPMGAGQWTTPLPARLPTPESSLQYAVTTELCAVREASGVGPSACSCLRSRSLADVTVVP